MKDFEIHNLLESITDDQAFDSDIGGDSDAEDNLVLKVNSTERSTTRSSSFDSSTVQSESNSSIYSVQQNELAGPSCTERTSRPIRSKRRIDFSKDDLSSSEEFDDSDKDLNFLPSSPLMQAKISSSSDENSDDTTQPIQNTQQQNNSSDYQWDKTGGVPTKFTKCNFKEKYGFNANVDSSNTLNFFELFFNITFLNLIVSESNLYASQMNTELNLTAPELKAVIGVLIIMGMNVLPSMRLYWSEDDNFHHSKIGHIMTVKRFLKIIRFIHLNDNQSMPPRESLQFDRLYKIRPMITHLNRVFPEMYSPSRYLSVDESMIAFTGRTTMKQYMPLKPIKRGFKVWVIACAVSGYMYSFDIYTGKALGGEVNFGLGEKVVLLLTRALEHLGYCIFFDNFFSSIPLMEKLLTKHIFACGTFRKNRKFYPSKVLKNDKDMKKGDLDFVQCGDITVTKWKDRGKNPVNLLSNMHNGSEKVNVLRTNTKGVRESVPCSKSISDYNAYMGGVDRFDQLLAVYSISWKSRRWWLKIFYYLLDCCIVNSYICYKYDKNSKKEKCMTQLQFRSNLANSLISNFSSRKRKHFTSSVQLGKKRVKTASTFIDVGIHIPIVGTYRRCAYCSTKTYQKRSNLICKNCDKALCKECFGPYHVSVQNK